MDIHYKIVKIKTLKVGDLIKYGTDFYLITQSDHDPIRGHNIVIGTGENCKLILSIYHY